jgi:FMN phosphatase YigB (HAD superfamily)
VLGNGLKDGLAQGASRSLNDICDFGKAVQESPTSALTDLVKNHWTEAAVAAGISFVAPGKLASTLIAAVSLRGVASATFDSAILAAEPKNDTNKVKDAYADSMSSESHALINSLPMTFAGGFAGKVGANAMFGKNIGAWDFVASGKDLSDIKDNLWDLHDKVMPPKAKMVVVDLDSTLVATNKHLSLGLEKAFAQIAENTGLEKQEVREAIYGQFNRLQTFGSSFTTELALGDKLQVGKPGGMSPEQFRAQVGDVYWKTLDEEAKHSLDVYDGVKSTLAELNAQKIPVVVFSNSTAEAALPRLAVHRLDAYTSKILALKNVIVPEGLSPELYAQGEQRHAARMSSPGSEKLVEVPRELRKPNPTALDQLITEANLRPKQVMMIGDSLKDDMGIAEKTGARGLWARYSEIDQKYESVMDGVMKYGQQQPATRNFESELHSFADVLAKLRPERDLKGFVNGISSLPSWYLPVAAYGYDGHEK